jgi:dephospho-CoA kinase
MRASGKGVFGSVARQEGLPVLEMSAPVLELMQKQGIAPTNTSIRDFATKLRAEKGAGVVAQLASEKIAKLAQGKSAAVVLGVRSPEEVEEFRKSFTVKLIAIDAPEEERLRRVKERGRPGDPTTMRELEWSDQKELGWGLGKAMELAGLRVKNDCALNVAKERMRLALQQALA